MKKPTSDNYPFQSQIRTEGTGFSLVEMLVVIGMIAVLSTIGLTIYQGVQSKARDSIRKSDLNNLAIALEIYAQEHEGEYIPNVTSCPTNEAPFNNRIKGYMSDGEAPKDPKDNSLYCYISNDGTTFSLCAKLENTNDPDVGNSESSSCAGFNYGVAPK